nr:asparaginase [Nakamurella flavida]
MPRIAVLSLGGTITTPAERPDGARPPLTAADLVSAIPELATVADVRPVVAGARMSADLRATDIAEVARWIDGARRDGIDGVVVTQGTDTLEESAYLLDLLSPGDTPVVVTGAMRNPGRPGSDGQANLLAAVRTAAHPGAVGLGVLVVLDDVVHLARAVRKTHTTATGAFVSTPGPIGSVVEDRVRLGLRPTRRSPVYVWPEQVRPAAVPLVQHCFDDDDRLLRSVGDSGADGLVLAVLGAGHVGARLLPVIDDLVARMPVVMASRTGSGDLNRISAGYPGSERDLLGRGVVSAGALDPLKARILLMSHLTAGAPLPTLAAAYEQASG